ncbi:unnamed protein product [Blepharisma stoltei]|uniref:HMA domain-containing protein n=1 Tax=Blepharisma stoltei TaxID=1481888 RepID=A0AAU9J9K5_9CILI|nr:unnamed protein product [Blepharisma stoltei]
MEPGVKEIRIHAQMSCEGCSNSITRILNKVEGVRSVQCSVPNQTVVVVADQAVQPNLLIEKLSTWASASGKQISLIA